MIIFYSYVMFLPFVVLASRRSDPVVRVQQGLLAGKWEVTKTGRTYASFRGIPYARPPVGELRFREPQMPLAWDNILEVTKFANHCVQFNALMNITYGVEDCLYLNVFTPDPTSGASLPVAVFIHGGGFMYLGSDVCSPTNNLDRDMVVVTLQYRLGPFGFLSTADDVIPGNFGLKDQAFALKWIKQNIIMFGGNPDSITLSGHSAGAASVHYHYLSPLSRGLFHRGVAFSGSALCPWAYQLEPKRNAMTLASYVKCPETSKELIECLRIRTTDELLQAQIRMLGWRDRLFTPFVPTIEPASPGAFLTQHPYYATLAGDMVKLPLVLSFTSEEGLYPAATYQADPFWIEELEAQWDKLASHIFAYNDTLPLNERPVVAEKIKQKYMDGKPVSQKTFGQLVQALGDRLFVTGVGKLAVIHAANSGHPVYMYKYCYRGDFSLAAQIARNNVDYGVSHADDMYAMFEDVTGFVIEKAETKQMTNLLADLFYTYSAHNVPKFGNVELSSVKPGSAELDYLEIHSPTKTMMKKTSDFGHRSFWDSLGFYENENFKPSLEISKS